MCKNKTWLHRIVLMRDCVRVTRQAYSPCTGNYDPCICTHRPHTATHLRSDHFRGELFGLFASSIIVKCNVRDKSASASDTEALCAMPAERKACASTSHRICGRILLISLFLVRLERISTRQLVSGNNANYEAMVQREFYHKRRLQMDF